MPSIEFHSSILSKLWNINAIKSKDKGIIAGYIEGLTIKYRDGTSDKKALRTETKFSIKPQTDSQISQEQLQRMCQDLRITISTFRRSKLISEEECQEITECITNNENLNEKIQNPGIQDFIKLEYIFYPDQASKKLFWKAISIVPDVKLSLYSIKGFGLGKTPMSIRLLEKNTLCRTGFLTLDPEKRLVPLHPSDPKVSVFTLAGIWATGEENLYQDPLIYAAMLRFLFNEQIKSRVSPNGQSYLLLYFPHNQELPQFFEFQISGQANSWKIIEYSNEAMCDSKNNFKTIKINLLCHKARIPSSGTYSLKKFPISFQLKEASAPIVLSKNPIATKEVHTKGIKKLIMNQGFNSARGNSETRTTETSPGIDGIKERVKGCKPYISRQKDGLSAYPTSCRTSFNNCHLFNENRMETDAPNSSENTSLSRSPDYCLQTSPNNEEETLHKIIIQQQKQIQAIQQQLMLITQELDTRKQTDSHSSFASMTTLGSRIETSLERCMTQRNSIDRAQCKGIENNLTLPSSKTIQLASKKIKFTKAGKPLVNPDRLSPELETSRATTANDSSGKFSATRALDFPLKRYDSVDNGISYALHTEQEARVNCEDNQQLSPVRPTDEEGFLKTCQEEGNSKSLDNQPSTDTSAKDALSAIKETNESIYSPGQEGSNKKRNIPSSKQKPKVILL